MSTAVAAKNYGKVSNEAALLEHAHKLANAGKPIGFDIETGYDGVDREKLSLQSFHPDFKVVGYSYTNSTNWARYVPVAHDNGENIDSVVAARALWIMLRSGMGVAHNAAFELNGLSRWFREVLWNDEEVGHEVRESDGYYTVLSDTMLEAYLSGKYEYIGLKPLTLKVFGHKMTEFMDLFPDEDSELGPATPKTKRKYVRFNTRNLVPKVIEYACEDSVWCLALHQEHYDEVKDLLMFQTEMRLLPILCGMEREGLLLDWGAFQTEEHKVAEFVARLNEEIQQELSNLTGETINLNLASPKQVQDVLYNKLNLPVKIRSEATNAPSTGEKALRGLVKENPVIKKILEFRELNKLKSSYLTKYLNELSYAADGRAHPNHKQDGARTGRLAVDHVSYQQWPKPYHFELLDGSTYDLNYRDFLISPEDYRIIGYDYANVELRVLAAVSQEKTMLDAFNSGEDIHKATAAKMLGIPLDKVTKADRQIGKTLNFAIVYGAGADNIASLIGCSKEQAQEYLDQYFETFKGLKAWMDNQVVEGRKNKYVLTPFGRRFTVWEFLNSTEKWIQSKGERMTVNAPVQGGAADYMKIAMVRATKAIEKAENDGVIRKGDIRLFMTVHDALEFYVHKNISTQQAIDILFPAVSYYTSRVPGIEIKADWHEGYKWGSVVEIELDENRRIAKWERTIETPQGDKFQFEGNSLDEVVSKISAWEAEYLVDSEPEPKKEDTSDDGEPLVPVHVTETDMAPSSESVTSDSPLVSIVTISIAEAPTEEQFNSLLKFLKDHPGSNDSVRLYLKDEDQFVAFGGSKYYIVPSDERKIKMILPGAHISRGLYDTSGKVA